MTTTIKIVSHGMYALRDTDVDGVRRCVAYVRRRAADRRLELIMLDGDGRRLGDPDEPADEAEALRWLTARTGATLDPQEDQ